MKFTPELLFRIDTTSAKASEVLDLLEMIQPKPEEGKI
jgi:ribosome-binding factor A